MGMIRGGRSASVAVAALGFLATVVTAPAWADPPDRRLSLPLDHGRRPELVWIEPGSFRMGSPDSDALADEAEKPQREVRIEKGFYLGRTTVTAGRLINVNTATQAELVALPGIGPVIARRIIAGRPYWSVEELERVQGIGKRRLEEIRPLVTVK
jgi:competence ComEA-like helix-hairpin-helix protein